MFTLDAHARRDRLHARRAVPVTWTLYQFAKRSGASPEALERIWARHVELQARHAGLAQLEAK